ncbi:hypothetical protein AS9A_3331 [Hoyosella subflava DQS3-9A1]|uniref:Uncharacterized protein n=1 Tax=Hoyosella subflava (strain DSM 45089 / JCM 17490 / NBRC 109087 / DQS3-9A1) TaxID=443218 RepID=F6EPB3_HOYSD|nr:hypothetical protein AS9A_3331 [Hoyosella subflava DQS3-9A1]
MDTSATPAQLRPAQPQRLVVSPTQTGRPVYGILRSFDTTRVTSRVCTGLPDGCSRCLFTESSPALARPRRVAAQDK